MMKKRVLICPSDRAGVGYHRSINPAVYLGEYYGDEFDVVVDYEPLYNNEEYLKQYDIIHYHRQFGDFDKMEETLNRLDSLGIVSIMDIDDHWAPGIYHPMYLIIKNSEYDKKVLNNIKLARNITTTTETFANLLRKYNKNNVFVIPNALTTKEKQFISNPTKSDKLRIGWLGSSSHEEDIKLLKGLTSKLKSAKLIDKIQFVLCGFDLRGFISTINPITNEEVRRSIKPNESVWYRYEKIFTDDYSILDENYTKWLKSFKEGKYDGEENLPYRRIWTKSYKEYATNYNEFDVLLAPLSPNDFNRVKSQLKVIEASFMDKVLIASDIEPYRIDLKNALGKGKVFDNNGNSIIVEQHKNHKGWFEAIKFLIDNPDKIEVLKNNLKRDVMDKYSLETVSKIRRDFYMDLLKNK